MLFALICLVFTLTVNLDVGLYLIVLSLNNRLFYLLLTALWYVYLFTLF